MVVNLHANKIRRVFGFPDIHWWNRDIQALSIAMKAQRAFKPDLTVQGGDLFDATLFARHPRRKLDADSEYDYVEGELRPIQSWLTQAQDQTRGGRMVWVMGNHDEWLERWLTNVEGGSALRKLRPGQACSEGRKEFRVVPYTGRSWDDGSGRLLLSPFLMVVHGWAENKFAAERHLELAKPYSCVFNHTHRAEARYGTMADGTLTAAWNAGCLCKKQPVYKLGGVPSNWVHGFWLMYVGLKSFTLYTIPILGGSAVLPDGTEIHP